MKKGDIILVCIVLLLGIAGFFVIKYMNREDGGTLTVTVDGKIYETYDLDKDQEVSLEIDGWYNRFEIRDGRVSMIEADCPDHYCVDHAAIDKVNETIVCLPHRVVLEITGGGEEKEVDA
ncbi:NusG domain II-containing protein [Frisingicoccus sp.]|jgi:conserved hypothetical protein|uniref:NusG domain II-containing protein n=1 Tax=Frisingicoccus sp. TaxID=1918627 RepID=UPI0015BAF091|nr:NusG domain II-containing protein [Frisingicoccus sp.]MEE0751636.1 NusG domain II-containing protein [Frisingicoccus sp.]